MEREKIIQAAIDVFAMRGLKFTMDDIARKTQMSKRTLYQLYESKEALCMDVVEHCFAEIKEAEAAVYEDPSLSLLEKLRKIIIVLPERYRNIGLSQIGTLQEKMPKVYACLAAHLESGWELTIDLFHQAEAAGLIRPVNIIVVKAMVESTLQHFFNSDTLMQNGYDYEDAMEEMISILFDGLSIK